MKSIFFSLTAFFIFSCKTKVDLIIHNANVYTVDSAFFRAEAIAVHHGKIVEVGTSEKLLKDYDATELIDAKGKFIYPGFIDAHSHLEKYANLLQQPGIINTSSWDQVVKIVDSFRIKKNIPKGQWIKGRGWDQNDWEIKEFPNSDKLDSIFPDNPVILQRIDDHAAIANQQALKLGGIQAGDKLIGGEIVTKNGKLTGLLIDYAIERVTNIIPSQSEEVRSRALLEGQQNCFAAGLTTVSDCGIDITMMQLMQKMQDENSLKIRMFVMLNDKPENFLFLEKSGIIKTDRMHVRSFKVYGDGALGSRGACLIEPYDDDPGHYGFLLSNASHFDSVAARLYKNGFQICTHAIGDSGNRVILQTYAKYLKGKNDLRWRIEHAQVVNQNDFNWFSKYSIIPSVQPTHATSDMYWATERLGNKRVKNAYAFKKLLDQNQWIPLGTDFPVEDISPIKTFYAAVFRKDAKGWPKDGYQMENALSRKEALRGMTIWAAKSNFEEKEKGSIEKGKFADLVVLDQDLMVAPGEKILATKVVMTFVGGEMVFGK